MRRLRTARRFTVTRAGAAVSTEYPPMQKGASFNLDAVKAKFEATRAAMGK